MPEILKVKNLSKNFGKRTIIHNANLTINAGEFTLLTGDNGAGKTTLLDLIMGFHKADAGQILWSAQNIDLTGQSIAQRAGMGISYMMQKTALLQDITVEETITITQKLLKNRRWKQPPQLQLLLQELINLKDYKNQLVGALSGGEGRKLELLITLMFDAPLYLLDEPFSGWDSKSIWIAVNIFKELKKADKSILICNHGHSKSFDSLIDLKLEINNGKIHS